MAKRLKVGIPFFFDEIWIAGTYYIFNLISAFSLLEDKVKPRVTIYYRPEKDIQALKKIDYSHLKFEILKSRTAYNWFQRIVNKLWRQIKGTNLFENRPTKKTLDVFFPAVDHFYFDLIPSHKKVYWIPDLQEHFLPEFFTIEELSIRKTFQKDLLKKGAYILLSSNSSFNDFKKLYSNFNQDEVFVLPFAVSNSESFMRLNLSELLEKYKIKRPFFICSNQFWAHKNHIIVLKALKLLKKQKVKCHVVFTGNPKDYRQPEFYNTLIDYVKENGLENYTSFLGFIDRNEQLKLMNESVAIIQPSLFEGWSTVVEDAKSLNKLIVLSDLDVHKEQINKNVFFFDRNNENELASILKKVLKSNIDLKENNYNSNRLAFANGFIKVIEKIKKKKVSP